MTLQFSLPDRTPRQEEIDAAIRRAHRERAEAFRRMLRSFFSRSKAASARPERVPDLETAACG